MWRPVKRRITKKWEQLWETSDEKYLREELKNLEILRVNQQKEDLVELEKLKNILKSSDSKNDIEMIQTKIQLIHNSLTVVTNVSVAADFKNNNKNTSVINIKNESTNTNNNKTSSSATSKSNARSDDATYNFGR